MYSDLRLQLHLFLRRGIRGKIVYRHDHLGIRRDIVHGRRHSSDDKPEHIVQFSNDFARRSPGFRIQEMGIVFGLGYTGTHMRGFYQV